MEKIRLQCPVDEWYLTRIYSEIGYADSKINELQKQRLKRLIKPTLMILFSFMVNGILSLFDHDIGLGGKVGFFIGFLLTVTMIIGVVWFFKELKGYGKFTSTFLKHPERNKEIDLYEISKDGMKANFYNVDEYKYYFKWEDVNWGEVEEMQIRKRYTDNRLDKGKMLARLRAGFKEVREVIPDFPYEERLVHPDKRSLVFSMKNGRYNILPIPPTWDESGLADELIGFVQKRLGDDFLEEQENIDLLEVFFPNFYNRFFNKED